MSLLDEIVAHKRSEVRTLPVPGLPSSPAPRRSLAAAIRARSAGGQVALIAEIKRRSPSRPLIREAFDPPAMAAAYERGGAAALSVLTDERYFGGSLADLTAARSNCGLPVLRKDFIVDLRQVPEAKQAGADAVLLIAACLTDRELVVLREEAGRWDLEVLLEVHDDRELERALSLGFPLVGINNRDLASFTVDLATTVKLARRVRTRDQERPLLVSESGISRPEDLAAVAAAGCQAVLVGEALLVQEDLEAAARALLAISGG